MKKSRIYLVLILLSTLLAGCPDKESSCGDPQSYSKTHFRGTPFSDTANSSIHYQITSYRVIDTLAYIRFTTQTFENVCTSWAAKMNLHVGMDDARIRLYKAGSDYAYASLPMYEETGGSYVHEYSGNLDMDLYSVFGKGPGKYEVYWELVYPYQNGTQQQDQIWLSNRLYFSVGVGYYEYKAP